MGSLATTLLGLSLIRFVSGQLWLISSHYVSGNLKGSSIGGKGGRGIRDTWGYIGVLLYYLGVGLPPNIKVSQYIPVRQHGDIQHSYGVFYSRVRGLFR